MWITKIIISIMIIFSVMAVVIVQLHRDSVIVWNLLNWSFSIFIFINNIYFLFVVTITLPFLSWKMIILKHIFSYLFLFIILFLFFFLIGQRVNVTKILIWKNMNENKRHKKKTKKKNTDYSSLKKKRGNSFLSARRKL